MEILTPDDENSVQSAIAGALADAVPLEIVGGGTKRALGRPVAAGRTLSPCPKAGKVCPP